MMITIKKEKLKDFITNHLVHTIAEQALIISKRFEHSNVSEWDNDTVESEFRNFVDDSDIDALESSGLLVPLVVVSKNEDSLVVDASDLSDELCLILNKYSKS